MATYCPEDPVSFDLSCPICFEDYDILSRQRAPKLLLCLHTFCFSCAQQLWQADGTLECSLCRAVHSEVALGDLFDNPVILQHLRKKREEEDLELARRLDMEMRRTARTPEPPPDVIDLASSRVEEEESSEEERNIFNALEVFNNRPGTPEPLNPIHHLNQDDTVEIDSTSDLSFPDEDDHHHHNSSDSEGGLEEESDNSSVLDIFDPHVEEDEAEVVEVEEELPWMPQCLGDVEPSASDEEPACLDMEPNYEDSEEEEEEYNEEVEEFESNEQEEQEQEEEERWHSASDDITASWIDDDYSMDEETPENSQSDSACLFTL